jgi:NodT family efflux transporter outer membrane factor (OMF) lipoprotein
VSVPEQFETPGFSEQAPSDAPDLAWWKYFEDKQLEELMQKAFSDNYSLKVGWNRLLQSQALASVATSGRYPALDASGGVQRIRADNLETTSQQLAPQGGVFYETSYFQRNGLSFELDIWRRAASASQAEILRADASRADYENTALVLSGSLAESWFTYLEQVALKELIAEQIETSKTLLELTQLRYSIGRGTALSVFQQRQQTSSIESELPRVEAQLRRSKNAIAFLVGEMPAGVELESSQSLPELPEFPKKIAPIELLRRRPDLRASRRRLEGSEYDLASAFAERFPRLSVSLDYSFTASEANSLFERQLGSLTGGVLLPLIDGGRRRAVVRQKDARVEELMAQYSSDIISVFIEVENALLTEKYQAEFLSKLNKQLEDARATLRESRSRYINGLTEYLDVTIALQTVQSLERRIISEKRALLVARVRLYLALGGNLKPNKEKSS